MLALSNTPLEMALRMVELLLSYDVDVTYATPWKDTALVRIKSRNCVFFPWVSSIKNIFFNFKV